MKKTLLMAGAAALVLSLAACGEQESSTAAGQQPNMNPTDKALMTDKSDGPDKAFIVKAANSNMFEIESSKIASERSKNPKVKKFADQMIADHTKAGTELKSIAGDKVPPEMDAATLAKVEKVKAASDDGFDATYIDEQKAAHDEAVGLFTNFTTSGEDAKLKGFAEKTLPTLKMHQDHVKALNVQ